KQPFGDKETKHGALHRARFARDAAHSSYGIGLEGGVMLVEDQLFLCNWGVIVDSAGNSYSASGARVELPQHFTTKLKSGTELSDLMDSYVNRTDIRHHEGAIGIFTNNLVDRSTIFTH